MHKHKIIHPMINIFVILILLHIWPHATNAYATDEGILLDGKTEDFPTLSLIQAYSWTTILPMEFIDLQNEFLNNNSLLDVEEDLPNLFEEIEKLRWETNIANNSIELEMRHIAAFQKTAINLSTKLDKHSKPVTEFISDLFFARTQWERKKTQLEGFKNQGRISMELSEEQLQQLHIVINKALQFIDDRVASLFALGKEIGDAQIILYSIESDLKELNNEIIAESVRQTSPSMLSPKFYTEINTALLKRAYDNSTLFIKKLLDYLKVNIHILLIAITAILSLAFAISKTRKLTTAASRWYPFSICPLSTSIFFFTSINATISLIHINAILPQHFQTVLHIVNLFAVIRLTTHLVKTKWWQRLMILLTFFMAITMIMTVLDFPQLLIILYVFLVSLLALIYYFLQLPRSGKLQHKERLLKRSLGIFPAIFVISGVAGYNQFAVLIYSTLLKAILICLIVWMMYLLILGILDFAISRLPFSLIHENRSKIVESLLPIVAWLHLLYLFAVQAVIWDLSPTVNQSLISIYNLGWEIGGLKMSPGFFFTVIFVIYGAFILSKGLQTILLSKVLPRYEAEKGVQLSIARLVHYAILTLGFIIILKVLGFKLNQLTLLGGALGVGIGFGLQAIVNNFASGLILLFERPIKVGDTIEIGNDLGEVKEMGLRATVIQTFDNAEIVVPNSDLVTGQVTNWTLAERRVRLRVSVGVAYGSDVSKVMKILIDCANANPMVLDTPKPMAFFLAFGASSLDFQLRLWIPEFLDKTQVLSDLNIEIENEFSSNGIEIPFPQTDLHLRSIDETVAVSLGRSSIDNNA